jgi:uncharacterized zinc-type alcohol dehydrogenase-like protein
MIKAYAAHEAGGKLQPWEYEPGALQPEQVEIQVEYCGICHSDLSMLKNDWSMTEYPFVPGHEVVGTVVAVGDLVTTVKVGQKVGLGWFAHSCLHCDNCMSGYYNLCSTAEGTIVNRHGGFADKVRANQEWVFPLPNDLNEEKAGPLFCGGITVFSPLVEFEVKATDKVGVIGIGGLGHMALQFLSAWGCDVTAFSSNPAKTQEARQLGANQVINSCNPAEIEAVANSFDFIICTANVDLDWQTYLDALKPKGRLHFVGVVPNPIQFNVFSLISAQKSISGSPLGKPTTIKQMLDFVAQHQIEPIIEIFKFEQVNEAIAHLESGKARYRIVLKH